MRADRGQAWTLDALLMAAVMVAGVVYAASVLPASTDQAANDDEIEAQLTQDARDILAVALETGTLHNATLYWNDSAGRWSDADATGVYTTLPPGHPLEPPVRSVFTDRGIAVNLEVGVGTTGGAETAHPLLLQGAPGSHAVSVAVPVVLTDVDYLSGTGVPISLNDSTTYFAPDAFPESPKYTVLRVRLTVWRH